MVCVDYHRMPRTALRPWAGLGRVGLGWVGYGGRIILANYFKSAHESEVLGLALHAAQHCRAVCIHFRAQNAQYVPMIHTDPRSLRSLPVLRGQGNLAFRSCGYVEKRSSVQIQIPYPWLYFKSFLKSLFGGSKYIRKMP